MKRISIFLMLGIFLTGGIGHASILDNGPIREAIKKIAREQIMRWAKDPIVMNAVKLSNLSTQRSPEEVARLDAKWIATEGVDEWMQGYQDNECARFLKSLQASQKGQGLLFPEIFVMDQVGCIVAETNKTTDFWQGDESKFTKSFAGGNGAVFIDEPSFDESSRIYTVQVSVPVMDPETRKAIGAMTVNIDLDMLAEQTL